jgi:uridylate kinase
MAGKYELIDIVALKVIERSRIPTWVLRSNVNNIKHAVDNDAKYHVGTEIVVEPIIK